MPSCVFDACCGCIELRTGCLVIGYIQLVGEIILIAIGLALLMGSAILADGKDAKTQTLGNFGMALSIFFLLIVFFLFAFTIVLLVGVHQNKRGHVKVYLVYSYVFLVLYILGLCGSLAETVTAGKIMEHLISIVLGIYFTLVIRSYYLKVDDKRPQIYNTAYCAAPPHPALVGNTYTHLTAPPHPALVGNTYTHLTAPPHPALVGNTYTHQTGFPVPSTSPPPYF